METENNEATEYDGPDRRIVWNTSAAEVTNTDYIDPDNSGFTLTGADMNVSSANYIFLAFA